ncbi:hypothetical protein M408DRAFT_271241 [Serendipita vermifera MAFF 305830]|uniref:DUF6533 domain-containing protein n=1 Tax=Serendipita vermifera MAFF 305830 TaxID=933852 RepID=A0A0C2WXH1_SERVB|nr:hypothetical protein M408DRAFT_271241 [Serendipita vermifera MAFF 305830]
MAQGLPSGGFEDGAAGIQLPPEITSLAQLEELVLYQSRNFLYSTVAMFTLLFYDYLITLNMEAKYIWASKDRISLTNALFVLNRYLPILRAFGYMVFSLRPPQEDPTCSAWTDANSYTTMISIGVVEILMGLRTWALWGKSRLIGIILLSVFVAAVCTSIVTVNLRLPPIRGIIPLAPTSILPCDRPSPYKYVLSYCAALVVELTTFVFMMGRIFHLIIKSKSQSRSRSGSIRNRSLALPIIRGLQRHGMSYFMAVIFVMAFTVISSYSSRLARMIVNAG